MISEPNALTTIIARENIRDLALLYARAADRMDMALMRSLYLEDAVNKIGRARFDNLTDFIAAVEKVRPGTISTEHYICNHLISIQENSGDGEVYTLACLKYVEPDGECIVQLSAVRYFDKYQQDNGRWRFAERVAQVEWRTTNVVPSPKGEAPAAAEDTSYSVLAGRIFARGARE